jgi:hypothetical protein
MISKKERKSCGYNAFLTHILLFVLTTVSAIAVILYFKHYPDIS